MAHITYPREFPEVPFNALRCRFDREPLGAVSRAANGAIAFQEFVGGGLWTALYETKPLNETQYGIWHAWKMSMRGNGTFKAYDPRRCYPIAYGSAVLGLERAGGGLFDGTLTVTEAGGQTLALSGLPANFQFTAGDYISFSWLDAQHLVKVLETITANASGVIAHVEIDPWLRADGTVPVTATVVRPWCTMKIVPGSWSGERTILDTVSFQAIQHLGAVITGEPEFNEILSAVSISPPLGTYRGPEYIILSDDNAATTIYYTTDGTPPDESAIVYNGPILITSSTTLRARAIDSNGTDASPEATSSYFINPAAALFNSEATAYKAAIISAGSTISDNHIYAVDTFIRRGKNEGWWDKIVDCGVFMGSSLAGALVKLKSPGGAVPTSYTNNGSPALTDADYSAAAGLTLALTDQQWLGTGIVPTTAGIDHPDFSCGIGTDWYTTSPRSWMTDYLAGNDGDQIAIERVQFGSDDAGTQATIRYCSALSSGGAGDEWSTVCDGMAVQYGDATAATWITLDRTIVIGKRRLAGVDTFFDGTISFAFIGSGMTQEELKDLTGAARVLHRQRGYSFGVTDFGVGDSMTWGQGSTDADTVWCALVSQAKGGDWINIHAAAGIATASALIRTRDIGRAFNVRYAFCLIGANNIASEIGNTGELNPTQLALYTEPLEDLILEMKAIGCTPIICGIPWYYTVTASIQHDYQDAAQAICDTHDVLFIPLMSHMEDTGNPMQYFVGAADIHMDQDGHDFTAALTEAYIDGIIPTLSTVTATRTSTSTANVAVTTDRGTGTMYFVVTQSPTEPSVSQIIAGQDHLGAAAKFAGSTAVVATGSVSISATGLTDDDVLYYAYAVQAVTSPHVSLISSSIGFVIDATTPVISAPSATKTGAETADLSVSTTVGSGTVYWVATTSSTGPTAAQIKAGQDHLGAAAGAAAGHTVTATGAQSISATRLVANTAQYAHFMHEGVSGLQSNVVSSASFTTDPWAPTALGTDLVAWYVADTGVYNDAGVTLATDGQTVQQWNDQSGNGLHLTQETSNRRPTYQATGFNGGKTINFTASTSTPNWFHTTAAAVTQLDGLNHHSWFAVGQMQTNTYPSAPLIVLTAGFGLEYQGGGRLASLRADGSGVAMQSFGNFFDPFSVAIATTINTDHTMGVVYDADVIKPYVDGVIGTTDTIGYTYNLTTGQFIVGASVQWTDPTWTEALLGSDRISWDGPISEIIVTKIALNATQIANMQTYFEGKWSL